ncbi:coiled-coil domain-containing protein 180 [Melanerpes formicivorus]|uniref:coiled-coil domain-containing protein 180 n=1 Tax=Melanerpes formicivorus TaxID=211600 RepID=UPI00358FF561
MKPVGAVHIVPAGQVYKQIFKAEVQLVNSLEEARNKAKFSTRNEKLPLDEKSAASAAARLLPAYQQSGHDGTPCYKPTDKTLLCRGFTAAQQVWGSPGVTAAEEVRGLPNAAGPEEPWSGVLEALAECQQGQLNDALASMHQELGCIAREMEAFVLEPQKCLLAKLRRSDGEVEFLLQKIELDTALGGFSFKELEGLWSSIQQQSLSRKKWIREMCESLKEAEWSRADRITKVLRSCTARLEEISYLSPDVHRLINQEAMLLNRALLANQRAIAQLVFNLLQSELKWKLSHQLEWQDRVKAWKLTQKNSIAHRFRAFMANEDIQNPPSVKREMENMLMDQILLHERRLEALQHLWYDKRDGLMPPAHTKAELEEWYRSLVNLNARVDAHHMQCLKRLHLHYEMVQQKCLAEVELCKSNLLKQNVCTNQEAEEFVTSELLQLPKNLQRQFEERLQRLERDFQELAEENQQNCRDLYKYCEEVLGLWHAHQARLCQQKKALQRKLAECRLRHDRWLQMKEINLDVISDKMRTASSQEKLKQYLKEALSSLRDIQASYMTFKSALLDEFRTYPGAVLQELVAYSTSISQYFHVKEIFKQGLQADTDSTFPDAGLLKASEAEELEEQQAGSIRQEDGGGKMDGHQGEKRERNTAEKEKTSAQKAEGTQEECGESIPHESEETEPAGQRAVISSSKAASSEIETFATSSGNSYTVLRAEGAGKADTPRTYFTTCGEESLPEHLKHVLIKEAVFAELKKRIRLSWFEHLEQWFAESLSSCHVFVAAKKEEVNSDLQPGLCAYQETKVKREIYDARAGELLLHKELLEGHCAELVEALKKETEDFLLFCDQQNNFSKLLEARMQDIESVFRSAPMEERLVSFKASVHAELQIHLKVIHVSSRSYRSYLEEALGNIRDSNVEFLRSCRLFSEGGTFSPEEVKHFSKCLQEQSKDIDTFESLIKAEMEQMESRCLEEATEIINQSDKKFHYIFLHREFMEKIQRCLGNLQLQIRSEVANSNQQALTLNSYLEKLHQKADACAHPAADKEALTSEEWYEFIKEVLKEVQKRSQYLDCLLGKATTLHTREDFALPTTDARKGSIAPAEHFGEENKMMLMGLDPDKYPVLIPSRMGRSALDDLAIGVIQNLLQVQLSKKHSGLSQVRNLRSRSAVLSSRKLFPLLVHEDPQSSATSVCAAPSSKKSSKKLLSKGRQRKHSKAVLSDSRLQLFGEKPPESDTFKGIIKNILWKGNKSLFCLAEEFYQEHKPQISMLEDLPGTFEDCAEVFEQNLLSYQSQAEEYHRSCLREFQDQLKLFEQELSHVSKLAVESLLREHQQKLSSSTAQIQQLFSKQLEEWENAKAVHKNQLHPSLGHSDNLLQLDALCQEEMRRQKDQADGICLHTQKLQASAAECAREFFASLAAFTEKLLLELDETVTIDDVQTAKGEVPREKTSTLLRRKLAGLPLELCEVKQFTGRGSRTWPGIPMAALTDNPEHVLCGETPPVTTAKTTLGHAAAVAARDAAYEKYKGEVEQQLARLKEESRAQLLVAQRWEGWWARSIQKIKQLYA